MSTAKVLTDSESFAAGVASTRKDRSTHILQFYSQEPFLIESVARFVAGPIKEGDGAVVIATKAHAQQLQQHLEAAGIDLPGAMRQGRCVFLDAAEILSQLMAEGRPQRSQFVSVIGGAIDRARAAAGGPDRRVVTFGEMVALLWMEGNGEAAIALEKLWNELAQTHRFHLRCAYSIKGFDKPEHAEEFLKICGEHEGIYPAEGYTQTVNEDERLRIIAQLQQKAEALEGEIAQRVRAEQALQQREAELREFLDSAVLPMQWIAADGTVLWANTAQAELLGYSLDEAVGRSIREFHADPTAAEDILQRFARLEQLRGYEASLRHKDGTVRWVRIHSNALVRDGQFIHTRCFAVDLTAEKKAASAQQLLAAIVASCDDGIASKDLNGVVTSWNAAAERIFGYKAHEIVGRPITLIIPPELQDDEQRILARIRCGEPINHFETVRITKEGRRLDVSLTISPVRDANGRVIGAAKVVRDITERKRSEEALRRAEKLATTGRLAATIAHEINNPMQALTNLLSLVSYKLSLDESTRQLVMMAEMELGRMSHITRQMLSFYRESTTPTAVKITDVLNDVFELFAMRMRSNRITLERRYECTGEIRGFPVELSQMFANLIGNAIEAVGDKGRISIHVAAQREISAPHREGIRVVIGDNGPGIKAELRSHIFEPFFTTKAAKGTGLGLWVVRGIVAKHEGSIRLRSTTDPGRSGTVVSVFLPLDAKFEVLSEETGASAAALGAA